MLRSILSVPIVVLAFTQLVGSIHAQSLRPTYNELGDFGDGVGGIGLESPRGRFILYEAVGPRGGPRELRMFDRAAGRWFSLGRGDVDYSWSARGDRLAFGKIEETGREMYVWTVPVNPLTGQLSGPPRRVSKLPGRGPTFSPDGRWIAYTAIPATDTAAPRIVVIPAAGGPERVLVRQPGWAQMLHWSPDGRWIYYRYNPVANSGGAKILARVSPNGGAPESLRKIHDFLGISRDGRFLAYIPADSVINFERLPLAIANADGVEIGRLMLPRDMAPKGWAASGLKILAAKRNAPTAIHAIGIRGGPVRALTTGTTSERLPVWSPDGRQIAFTALLNDKHQLMLVNAQGGARRQIATQEAPNTPPVWSPDGRYLAFLSGERGERVLNVVEMATGVEAKLGSAERIDDVGWRRDSRAVIYVHADAGRQTISEVAVGGHRNTLRVVNGELSDGSITLVGDSAFVVTSPNGVFAAPLRGNGQRKLYVPAEAEVEPRWYRSGATVSRDGRWIALPVSVKAGTATQDAIRILPVGGGEGRLVPIGYLIYMSQFIWHPDGRHLVVVGTRHQEQRLDVFLVPLNGEPLRPLTVTDQGLGLGAFSISPDGGSIVYQSLLRSSATAWEIDFTRTLAGITAKAQR